MKLLVDQLMHDARWGRARFALQRPEADLRAVVESAVGRIILHWQRKNDLELPAAGRCGAGSCGRSSGRDRYRKLVDNAFEYSEAGDGVRCDLATFGSTAPSLGCSWKTNESA